MNEMKRKADLLTNALKEANLEDVFEKVDYDEEGFVFRASQSMGNGKCVIFIDINSSVYTVVSYGLGELSNVGKKENMLNLLNDINSSYRTLKFFISSDNYITAQVLYACDTDRFDANLLLDIMVSSYNSIKDRDYAKIMRVMWA